MRVIRAYAMLCVPANIEAEVNLFDVLRLTGFIGIAAAVNDSGAAFTLTGAVPAGLSTPQ